MFCIKHMIHFLHPNMCNQFYNKNYKLTIVQIALIIDNISNKKMNNIQCLDVY